MPFADLNPKFLFFSPVRGTSTDLAEHVDHAIIGLDGRAPIGGDWSLEQLNPVTTSGVLRVELWVSDLADYTCTYGFLVSSENGRVPYARGERTVVNIDLRSRAPQKWSREFRLVHTELLKTFRHTHDPRTPRVEQAEGGSAGGVRNLQCPG